VPEGYPGVQYRRSKNLNDRYNRYEKNGTIVAGLIEDNGNWLRLAQGVYLPMKIGTTQILERLPNYKHNSGNKVEVGSGDNLLHGASYMHVNPPGTTASKYTCVHAPGDPEPEPPPPPPPPVLPAPHSLVHQVQNESEPNLASKVTLAQDNNIEDTSIDGMLNMQLKCQLYIEHPSHLYTEPINPFSDTPRGGSPIASPSQSRFFPSAK